jgi:tetratricopeptide (TPR) repeat protein
VTETHRDSDRLLDAAVQAIRQESVAPVMPATLMARIIAIGAKAGASGAEAHQDATITGFVAPEGDGMMNGPQSISRDSRRMRKSTIKRGQPATPKREKQPSIEREVVAAVIVPDEPLFDRLIGTVRQPGLLVVFLLLAIVTIVTYSNSYHCELVLDNYLIVGQDTRLKDFNWENVKLIFSRGYWWPTWESDLFRPLTTFSYLVNASLNRAFGHPGEEQESYHVVNWLLHLSNVLMFYGLVLGTIRKHWTAIAAAAIFAVHPLNTESVTNIVGRADLLVAFCVLGGLLLHRLSYDASVGGAIVSRVLMGLLALMGVFCKESAVVIVFAFILYDMAFEDLVTALLKPFRRLPYYPLNVILIGLGLVVLMLLAVKFLELPKECLILLPLIGVIPIGVFLMPYSWRKDPWKMRGAGERFLRKGWQSYVAITPAVIALLVARYFMLRNSPVFGQIGADNPIASAAAFTPHISDIAMIQGIAVWLTKFMTAVKVIGYYFSLFLWPGVLSCDYSYDQIPLFRWTFTERPDIDCWLGLVGCLAAAAVLVMSYWKNKALFFFSSFFWIGSGFFLTANLLIDIGSIMGERFMYLPMVGLVGILAALMPGFVAWFSRVSQINLDQVRVAVAGLAAVAVVALGVRSYQRNFDWMDEISLWTSAADACPDSFKVYKGLAGAIAGVNIEKESKREQGDRFALLGLTKDSDEIDILNQAILTCEKGRKILDDQPLPYTDMPNGVYQDIARYYLNKGDTLTKRVDPTMQQLPDNAKQAYERSAEALERARDMDRAVNTASRKARLERGVETENIMDVGNFRIYQNLGVAYLRLRRLDDAVQAFKDMRRLEPMSADVYYNLGVTTMQMGNGDEACKYLLQALVLNSGWFEAWDKLALCYSHLAPGQQIITIDPRNGQRNLNADHSLARRHLNDALTGLMQVMIDTKRWEQAKQMREMAVGNYKASPDLFFSMQMQLPKPPPTSTFSVAWAVTVLIVFLGAVALWFIWQKLGFEGPR